MKVYLAGGINGLSDTLARDWRNYVKAEFEASGKDIEALDPMVRDYRGVEALHTRDIVEGDIADIDACHAVIAMCQRPSWGTAMEIFYAHRKGTPVYAVIGMDPQVTPSPWLAHHSKAVFLTLDAAVRAVLEQTS